MNTTRRRVIIVTWASHSKVLHLHTVARWTVIQLPVVIPLSVLLLEHGCWRKVVVVIHIKKLHENVGFINL